MDEFLKSIICSGECLSWFLIFLNILAIFFLIFCSFWRVTKIARVTGWMFVVSFVLANIGILMVHTCIYTLLTTIFTVMMVVAILCVILPNRKDKYEETNAKLGYYVISKTDDERYVFAIHDDDKNLIVQGKYSYATADKVKEHIKICRENGMMAAVNDRTGTWVKEEAYPLFEINVDNGKYYFCLAINEYYNILESKTFSDINKCKKQLELTKRLIASLPVYLNKEIIFSANYICYYEPPNANNKDEFEPVIPDVNKKSHKEKTQKKLFDIQVRSFKQKLKSSSQELKQRYKVLDEKLNDAGFKRRESHMNASYYLGRETLAKLSIKGKTLSLHLALSPKDYEGTKYNLTDLSKIKRYKQTPLRLKITSNRALKWAQELIDDVQRQKK